MRLVGPDCFGVAVPSLGLDATFAARPARPGVTGLVMQSGGLGFALVDHLSRLGIGISSFASVGDKLDVSGNDMLLWWERDERDQAGRAVPGVVRQPAQVRPDGPPGQLRHARPHRAGRHRAGRHRLRFQEALFEQAGVITTRGFGELIEAAALLATQPVPAGRTVAIVSNVRSAGQLAASAGAAAGLRVRHPVETTDSGVRRRLPRDAWSSSPRTTRCTPSSRSCCPPGPPATWRRRSGRRPPENHSPPSC